MRMHAVSTSLGDLLATFIEQRAHGLATQQLALAMRHAHAAHVFLLEGRD